MIIFYFSHSFCCLNQKTSFFGLSSEVAAGSSNYKSTNGRNKGILMCIFINI